MNDDDRHDLFQDCMAMLRSDDFATANEMVSAMIDRVLDYEYQEPSGWKLVPINPTKEMEIAFREGAGREGWWHEGYWDMLAVAPKLEEFDFKLEEYEFGDDDER